MHDSRSRSPIIGTVGGEKIRCQTDSGVDKSIMREDFYMRIAERYKLDDECVVLQGSGSPMYTLGNVLVPKKLCGIIYNLMYTL